MAGLKLVFLLSLVAGAFVVANAETDTLDSLLQRMLDEIRARNVATAQDYVQRLTAALPEGGSSMVSISVLDMTKGDLLAHGGKGVVPLTDMQMNQLAAAVKNGRFQAFDQSGLKVGGNTYRLLMSTAGTPVVRFGGRAGTILTKKTVAGAVVILVPAGVPNREQFYTGLKNTAK